MRELLPIIIGHRYRKGFECSECGAAVTVAYECFKDGCYYDYCPYCGAKMEVEET